MSKKRKPKKKRIVIEPVIPLNTSQRTYLEMLKQYDCVIANGPAGTGKTFLACAYAIQELVEKRTDKIVLTRPIVGTGKTVGFLPGSLRKKMGPWTRPLIDAFKRSLPADKFESYVPNKIEILSLEHVRGLTFDDAIIILDEAQNSTIVEMKALLTRVGTRTKILICGDTLQSDLRGDNGLDYCLEIVRLGLVKAACFHEFNYEDVVRSDLCKEWIKAFFVFEKVVEKEKEV